MKRPSNEPIFLLYKNTAKLAVKQFYDCLQYWHVQQVAALLKAAAEGDLTQVRNTLETSSTLDVNSEDYSGATALHAAALEGHLDVVEYLVKFLPFNLQFPRLNFTNTVQGVNFKKFCRFIINNIFEN